MVAFLKVQKYSGRSDFLLMGSIGSSSWDWGRQVMGIAIFLEEIGGSADKFFFINPFVVFVGIAFPFGKVLSGVVT